MCDAVAVASVYFTIQDPPGTQVRELLMIQRDRRHAKFSQEPLLRPMHGSSHIVMLVPTRSSLVALVYIPFCPRVRNILIYSQRAIAELPIWK